MSHNNFPDNLLYSQDYSWVKIASNTATLGLIKPAADKVKEFVFIKLPQKGQVIKKGETYASVEALKWSGHLTNPLSGRVLEVNEPLFDDPAIINRDPYGQGWIVKIEISDKNEANDLLDAKTAAKELEDKINKNQ